MSPDINKAKFILLKLGLKFLINLDSLSTKLILGVTKMHEPLII